MSSTQPALITSASAEMGAVYAGCFTERFRDASANSSEVRILGIAAHPVFRAGIGAIIVNEEGISQLSSAATGWEGIEAYRADRPDVTLLDLHLPDMSGIEVLNRIRSEFPDARVIILATFQRDVEIRRALQAGAYGYLLKSAPPHCILEAIRRVHSGSKCIPREIAAELVEYLSEDSLSQREIEVLSRVANGERNREIGKELLIAEETVKVHLEHIMSKLGAKNRTHAVTIAARRGFLSL